MRTGNGARFPALLRWSRRFLLVIVNSSTTALAGLLHFRLITFGLYEPHWLYGAQFFSHPSWQVNPRILGILLQRLPAYACWLEEMEAVRRSGPKGYWRLRSSEAEYIRFQDWITRVNTGEER